MRRLPSRPWRGAVLTVLNLIVCVELAVCVRAVESASTSCAKLAWPWRFDALAHWSHWAWLVLGAEPQLKVGEISSEWARPQEHIGK